MLLAQQLDLMEAGRQVKRFHTVPTLKDNTVGDHSFGVALLVMMLGGSGDAVKAALVHDLAESHYGDVPAPTKRLDAKLGQLIDAMEDAVLAARGWYFALSAEDQRILKLADCFDGMLYCCREVERGNRGEIELVFDRYENYVLAMRIHDSNNEREGEVYDYIRERFNEVCK